MHKLEVLSCCKNNKCIYGRLRCNNVLYKYRVYSDRAELFVEYIEDETDVVIVPDNICGKEVKLFDMYSSDWIYNLKTKLKLKKLELPDSIEVFKLMNLDIEVMSCSNLNIRIADFDFGNSMTCIEHIVGASDNGAYKFGNSFYIPSDSSGNKSEFKFSSNIEDVYICFRAIDKTGTCNNKLTITGSASIKRLALNRRCENGFNYVPISTLIVGKDVKISAVKMYKKLFGELKSATFRIYGHSDIAISKSNLELNDEPLIYSAVKYIDNGIITESYNIDNNYEMLCDAVRQLN